MLFQALIIFGAIAGLVIAMLGHPKIGGALLGGRCRTADHKLNEGV